MQFSIRSIITAVLALTVATPVLAEDFRELVQFSHKQYESGTAFCDAWAKDCRAYKPNDQSLVYVSSICEQGDYQGKHKNTEALVSCVFEKALTKNIAKELHAKLV